MIENALLTSLLYFTIVFLMIFTCHYIEGFTTKSALAKGKISFFEIILYSALFSLFNFCLTNISLQNGKWTGDRGNYLYSFIVDRSNSVGLDILYGIAHFYSFDFYDVLYTTTFICCVLFFVAYKKMEHTSALALLFFLSTDVVFLTFAQLKQCYAIGFSFLFFAFMLQERKNDVICLILAILSACFHTTGFILILLYFIVRKIDSNGKNFKYVLMSTILVLLFMKPVLQGIADLFSGIIPSLSSRILKYFFVESSSSTDGSWLTFVKGCPYYVVTFFSLVRRKELSKEYANYDKFVFLSMIGSFLYLLSIVSYWMFRFTSLFYMPIAVLFGMIASKERDPVTRFILITIVIGTLIIVRVRHIILTYVNYGGY